MMVCVGVVCVVWVSMVLCVCDVFDVVFVVVCVNDVEMMDV